MACVGADLRVRPQNRLRSGEDRRTHRSAPTKGYSSRCCTIRRVPVTKEATACGLTNHSPQSKEQSSERLGDIGAYKGGGRPPLAGGRTGAVDSLSPTHKGSINQVTSSVRGSFGALPLRPTAMIRWTSHEVLLCASVYYAAGITAFDGWICRVDVIRVGADLRVIAIRQVRPLSTKQDE